MPRHVARRSTRSVGPEPEAEPEVEVGSSVDFLSTCDLFAQDSFFLSIMRLGCYSCFGVSLHLSLVFARHHLLLAVLALQI